MDIRRSWTDWFHGKNNLSPYFRASMRRWRLSHIGEAVLPWDMVDKSISHHSTYFRLFFVSGQSRQAISSRSEAPAECCCWHLHPSARDMTLHPPLACEPLKRKPVARSRRAPRVPSIVGWFCQLPWPASAVGTVAPDVCPLVLQAA